MDPQLPQLTKRIHAKAILAGEHAVIRGRPALLLPVPSKYVEMAYWKENKPFQVVIRPNQPSRSVLGEFIQYALQYLNLETSQVQGRVEFHFFVLPKSGLGGSACLAVGFAKLFHYLGHLNEEQMFDYAMYLDNFFHGEGSGADVAAVLAERPIVYYRDPLKILYPKITWHPHLYLTPTGETASTKKCIENVTDMYRLNPDLENIYDRRMEEGVKLCIEGLASYDQRDQLIMGIEQASDVFEKWGLITDNMREKMQQLKEAGALAVKPSGSGLGGFLLSLWDDISDKNLTFELIPLFEQKVKFHEE